MGQTLTHGVYLPDEGERNCYNGLASNWNILDGAVGTIAEHTAALSGKAPLVHTHTKSDITDFPAYGTTAGTICEGNDSRLSDARTPVAHTHTKSDVTDLLNSNFIPSANNSYDLGSANNQWNNVYAKNYYYNGVAWGLDKANEWTGTNTFKTTVTYDGNFACYWKRANLTAGTLPSTTMYYGTTRYADSAGTTITLSRGLVDPSGKNYFRQYTYAFSATSKFCSMGSGIDADGSNSYFAFNAENLIPNDNNTTNLGTSTNKWKSFNGVNPGALSFFDTSSVGDIIDTNNWNTNGGTNEYTPAENGWVYFRIAGVSGNYIVIRYTNPGQNYPTISKEAVSLHLSISAPAIAGIKMYIFIVGSIDKAYFYPALGNV